MLKKKELYKHSVAPTAVEQPRDLAPMFLMLRYLIKFMKTPHKYQSKLTLELYVNNKKCEYKLFAIFMTYNAQKTPATIPPYVSVLPNDTNKTIAPNICKKLRKETFQYLMT